MATSYSHHYINYLNVSSHFGSVVPVELLSVISMSLLQLLNQKFIKIRKPSRFTGYAKLTFEMRFKIISTRHHLSGIVWCEIFRCNSTELLLIVYYTHWMSMWINPPVIITCLFFSFSLSVFPNRKLFASFSLSESFMRWDVRHWTLGLNLQKKRSG